MVLQVNYHLLNKDNVRDKIRIFQNLQCIHELNENNPLGKHLICCVLSIKQNPSLLLEFANISLGNV